MDAGRSCERHDAHAINDVTTTSSNAYGTHVVPFYLLRKQNDRDEASQNAARCCNNNRYVFLC